MNYYALILLAATASSAASAEPASPKELATIEIVNQFVEGCVTSYPNPEKFSLWRESRGLSKLQPEDAAEILGGKEGDAWSAKTPNGSYLLAGMGKTACSVFATNVDLPTTRKLIGGFMEFLQEQGYSYVETDTTPRDAAASGYTTISYAVSKSGKPAMRVVLTLDASGTRRFQVALTASNG